MNRRQHITTAASCSCRWLVHAAQGVWPQNGWKPFGKVQEEETRRKHFVYLCLAIHLKLSHFIALSWQQYQDNIQTGNWELNMGIWVRGLHSPVKNLYNAGIYCLIPACLDSIYDQKKRKGIFVLTVSSPEFDSWSGCTGGEILTISVSLKSLLRPWDHSGEGNVWMSDKIFSAARGVDA